MALDPENNRPRKSRNCIGTHLDIKSKMYYKSMIKHPEKHVSKKKTFQKEIKKNCI